MVTLVVRVCCWLLGCGGYVVVGGGVDVMIGGYGENDIATGSFAIALVKVVVVLVIE